MNKVADDAKPMTGIWYTSTTDPNVRAKVSRFSRYGKAYVIMTGGVFGCYTVAEFAEFWRAS